MNASHGLSQQVGTSVRPHSDRPNGVKAVLTPHRTRRVVENDDYGAFARRILRSYARRIARGDIDALAAMTTLANDIDAAVAEAITGLRSCGYSWADVGSQLGVTRQAAQQRWGSHPATPPQGRQQSA